MNCAMPNSTTLAPTNRMLIRACRSPAICCSVGGPSGSRVKKFRTRKTDRPDATQSAPTILSTVSPGTHNAKPSPATNAARYSARRASPRAAPGGGVDRPPGRAAYGHRTYGQAARLNS